MKKREIRPIPSISRDCKNEQIELNLLLKMFRGVHPVLVIPDVHGRELAEKLGGGGAMPLTSTGSIQTRSRRGACFTRFVARSA